MFAINTMPVIKHFEHLTQCVNFSPLLKHYCASVSSSFCQRPQIPLLGRGKATCCSNRHPKMDKENLRNEIALYVGAEIDHQTYNPKPI